MNAICSSHIPWYYHDQQIFHLYYKMFTSSFGKTAVLQDMQHAGIVYEFTVFGIECMNNTFGEGAWNLNSKDGVLTFLKYDDMVLFKLKFGEQIRK